MTEGIQAATAFDDKAVKTLTKKVATESQRVDRTMADAEAANSDADAYRASLQSEFRKVGLVLDLTAVEEAEQAAMEEWAVRRQAQALQKSLGSEAENVSNRGRARLQALAQRQAEELAKLMN